MDKKNEQEEYNNLYCTIEDKSCEYYKNGDCYHPIHCINQGFKYDPPITLIITPENIEAMDKIGRELKKEDKK